jgi:hypothetical protein
MAVNSQHSLGGCTWDIAPRAGSYIQSSPVNSSESCCACPGIVCDILNVASASTLYQITGVRVQSLIRPKTYQPGKCNKA